MKRIAAICFAGALFISGAPVAGAASAGSHHRAPMVVATWFSNTRPTVGQKEAVYVQFFSGKTKFAGGRLTATITGASKALKIRGTLTNRHGIAFANFNVPAHTAGHWLRAYTYVTYKGHRYTGTNRVQVSK